MAGEEVDYTVSASVVINGSRREGVGKMKIGFLIDQLPMPQAVSDIKSLLTYKLLLSPVVQFYDASNEKWHNIGWFAPYGDCSLGGIGCYIDADGLLRFAFPADINGRPLKYYYDYLNIMTDFTGEDAYIRFTDANMNYNEGLRGNFEIESTVVRQEWVRWEKELYKAQQVAAMRRP